MPAWLILNVRQNMKALVLSRILIGLGVASLLICILSLIGPMRVDKSAYDSHLKMHFSVAFTATPAGWIIGFVLLIAGVSLMARSKKA